MLEFELLRLLTPPLLRLFARSGRHWLLFVLLLRLGGCEEAETPSPVGTCDAEDWPGVNSALLLSRSPLSRAIAASTFDPDWRSGIDERVRLPACEGECWSIIEGAAWCCELLLEWLSASPSPLRFGFRATSVPPESVSEWDDESSFSLQLPVVASISAGPRSRRPVRLVELPLLLGPSELKR